MAELLGNDLWERLIKVGTPRRYAQGAVLMRQGDRGESAIALITGRVTVSLVDAAGNDVLLSVRGDGELLGEMALLGDGLRSATVIALDTCRTAVLTTAQFNAFARANALEAKLFQHMVRRFQEGERIRAELASLPARPRIISCLLRLAQSSAGLPDRTMGIDVGIGQSDLVRAVGLARSTVAEEIARLKDEAAVLRSRAPMVVDPGRLLELASKS
jgi:CRP/FNR family transcriptional regulator, cyclic AMP receptor protein